MKRYKTVLQAGHFEIDVQKSRFIGHVCPVSTEEEALSFIERVRKLHWNATHNVPVYLIGVDYHVQRYSDDGEPSGTAGIPVMEMLKKEGMTNLCVVITRYFGGIKLGTGGLVRAYTDSAKAVLESVGIIEKRVYMSMTLYFDYTLHGKIQNYCMNRSQMLIEETAFTDKVCMKVWIDPDCLNQVVSQLIDLTSNQIEMSEPEGVFLTFKDDKYIEV